MSTFEPLRGNYTWRGRAGGRLSAACCGAITVRPIDAYISIIDIASGRDKAHALSHRPAAHREPATTEMTMATRNSLAEKSFDPATGILTFKWSDDSESTIDVKALPDDIKLLAAAHGVSQKGGDSYASAGTKADDAGMTPLAWAKAQCKSVLDAIRSGDWSRAGAGGGGEPALIVEALARVYGVTTDEAEAKIDAMSKEGVKALKAMPDIIGAIAAVKVERDEKRLARSRELAASIKPVATDKPRPSFDELGA